MVTRALGGIFSSSLFCFALNKVLFFFTALAFCIYFSTYNYAHRCVSDASVGTHDTWKMMTDLLELELPELSTGN